MLPRIQRVVKLPDLFYFAAEPRLTVEALLLRYVKTTKNVHTTTSTAMYYPAQC